MDTPTAAEIAILTEPLISTLTAIRGGTPRALEAMFETDVDTMAWRGMAAASVCLNVWLLEALSLIGADADAYLQAYAVTNAAMTPDGPGAEAPGPS